MPRNIQKSAPPRVVAPVAPKVSDAIRALGCQTRHSFHPGRGYFEHDTFPVIHSGPAPVSKCDPPLGTVDGSKHVLSRSGAALVFTWVAAEKAWARVGGHRMAFTAEYLTREGWKYVGPT